MKRQANALTAVLENWKDVESAIDIYANSAGSALRENEIYLDSWEAKSKAVSAAWNEFVNTFINSDSFKGFLDFGRDMLQFFADANAAIPLLAGLLAGMLASSIFTVKKEVDKLTISLSMANLVSGGIPILIGAITSLIGIVISWSIANSDVAKQIENLTEKIEEQQKAIDELNAKEKDAVDLYKQYASLLSKSNAYGLTSEEKESLLKISNDLVNTYGLEVEGIDAITGAYIIGAGAVNDYVEALRKERLEREEKQEKTRNDRIDKNLELLDGNVSSSQLEKTVNDIRKGINQGAPLPTILSDYNDETLQDVMDYVSSIGKSIDELTDDEIRGALTKSNYRYANALNSIIKDVLTNIQVKNADYITQSGEDVLTSMMQSLLPNIDDLDEDKIKDIQDKINNYVKNNGMAFDELGKQSQDIKKRLNDSDVGLSEYKDLLENQLGQLDAIGEIFGETSEEANAFRDQLNKSIENNAGLSFAHIAKTMDEAELDTTQFDKVTSAILKLDKAMSDGEITFSEYVGSLNKELDNISLENTFKNDEKAAKSFFAVLNDKGKDAIQNLMAQYQNGEISQKDYLSGISDMINYFENLSSKSTLIFGIEDTGLTDAISELKAAQTELNNFKSIVQTIPDTFDEFKNGGIKAVNELTSVLQKAGITAMEIGGKMRNSSKEIADAMFENAENFAEAKEKLVAEFKDNLTRIGSNLAIAVNKMIEIFGEVKIVLTPPEVSFWDFVKGMFTGKFKEMPFGVRIDGEADPESWAKGFGSLADELDWGFDDFSGGSGGKTPPFTPTNTDKDSSKNNPDYEDPTDAIVNRINLRAKELEQEEQSIQNAIEIAELEKDYKKQISLTNDKLDVQRQKVDALKIANNELHQMAENLRNSTPQWNEESWFNSQGQATEAYNTLYNNSSKEEQEKLKNQFEKISKIKKAWVENDEKRLEITKEILQTEEELVNLDFENSQEWIDERNRLNDWQLFDDNEIAAWERVIKRLKEDYKDCAGAAEKIKEAEQNLFEARQQLIEDVFDAIEKIYDLDINRLNSKSTLLSSHYELINAINEEQHNLNKELAEAEIAGAKMNEIERETLFTKEEHAKLSEKLTSIMNDANNIQSDYLADLETATEDTIEEITNNYERQYELKLKEYEIVKAELEVAKAQQRLENVENEKSVRTWDGKSWIYEANLQDVIDAQNAVEDAKYELQRSQAETAQQIALNKLDHKADSLETEKNKFTTTLDEITGKAKLSGKELSDALNFISENDLPVFEKIIQSVGETLEELLSADDRRDYSFSSIESYKYSSTVAKMKANSEKWRTASESERNSLRAINQGLGDSIGADYDDATGTWKDKNGNRLYANGTKNAKSGLGLFDENGIGSEFILTNEGIIHQFDGGEMVFSPEMKKTLWTIAQNGVVPRYTMSDFGGLTSVDNSVRTTSSDTYYSINGVNIKPEEDVSIKGFVNYLKKKF